MVAVLRAIRHAVTCRREFGHRTVSGEVPQRSRPSHSSTGYGERHPGPFPGKIYPRPAAQTRRWGRRSDGQALRHATRAPKQLPSPEPAGSEFRCYGKRHARPSSLLSPSPSSSERSTTDKTSRPMPALEAQARASLRATHSTHPPAPSNVTQIVAGQSVPAGVFVSTAGPPGRNIVLRMERPSRDVGVARSPLANRAGPAHPDARWYRTPLSGSEEVIAVQHKASRLVEPLHRLPYRVARLSGRRHIVTSCHA